MKENKREQLKEKLSNENSLYTYRNNKNVLERYYTINDYLLLHLDKISKLKKTAKTQQHTKVINDVQIEWLKERYIYFNNGFKDFSFGGPIIKKPPRCPKNTKWGMIDVYNLINSELPPGIKLIDATLIKPNDEQLKGIELSGSDILQFDSTKITIGGNYRMKINLRNESLGSTTIEIDQLVELIDKSIV